MQNNQSEDKFILPYEFIHVGYSIREKEGVHLEFHKPNCRIITVDVLMQPPHPLLKKAPMESVGGYSNPTLALRYDIGFVNEMYGNIIDRIKYSIFAYSIHKDDILKYTARQRSQADDKVRYYRRFSYALINPIEPRGRLLGYDIVDLEFDLSVLINMGVEWRIAEKYGILNENHLFTNSEAAINFKKEVNKRDPGHHAPYAVWRIYEVDTESMY